MINFYFYLYIFCGFIIGFVFGMYYIYIKIYKEYTEKGKNKFLDKNAIK